MRINEGSRSSLEEIMGQRGNGTYPRSPGSLTPEHEWVTTMLSRPLQGSLVSSSQMFWWRQPAQHPGAPELYECTRVRSLLGDASAMCCVTLDKSCPNWWKVASKISKLLSQSCQKRLSEPRVANIPLGCSSCLQSLLQMP